MTTEPETIEGTAVELIGVAHLLGALLNGVHTAEQGHLGYVRVTLPMAHAVPAVRLLGGMLVAVRDQITARTSA